MSLRTSESAKFSFCFFSGRKKKSFFSGVRKNVDEKNTTCFQGRQKKALLSLQVHVKLRGFFVLKEFLFRSRVGKRNLPSLRASSIKMM